MGVGRTTVKENCEKHGIATYLEKRPAVLVRLKRVGAGAGIGSTTQAVTLVAASGVKKLWKKMGLSVQRQDDVGRLVHCEPPPLPDDDQLALPEPDAIAADTHPLPTFPATLPTILLTHLEKSERYGLHECDLPFRVKTELATFKAWCTASVNMLRTGIYAAAVQSTTMETQLCAIRGFLGYVVHKLNMPLSSLGLHVYSDAHNLAHFTAYLQARAVNKAQVCGCGAVHRGKGSLLPADALSLLLLISCLPGA